MKRMLWKLLDWLTYRRRVLDFTLDEKKRKAWILGGALRKIL